MIWPRASVKVSEEVAAWARTPLPDPRLAKAVQQKFERTLRQIEVAGPLAGCLEKPSPRDLYETRIDDWRVFGRFEGSVYYMGAVIPKHMKRLSARRLDAIEEKVAAVVRRNRG